MDTADLRWPAAAAAREQPRAAPFARRRPNAKTPIGRSSHKRKTIFNRYNEVSDILANRPQAYRPIFMVDDDGSIVVRDWAVGFVLGIGLRRKEWGEHILLTKHRQVLVPILVYCEGQFDLLPDMPTAEKSRHQATEHEEIARAVAAARTICNPFRAAEARQRPVTRRRASRTRR